jgi:multiple antibiotic resistance protein
VVERDDIRNVAVFPLAIPLIAGPGAISATILLASQAPDASGTAGLMAIIILMIGACLVVFLAADRIEKALGETGRIVVSRLLGLILAALSVQFVADGVTAIVMAAT